MQANIADIVLQWTCNVSKVNSKMCVLYMAKGYNMYKFTKHHRTQMQPFEASFTPQSQYGKYYLVEDEANVKEPAKYSKVQKS